MTSLAARLGWSPPWGTTPSAAGGVAPGAWFWLWDVYFALGTATVGVTAVTAAHSVAAGTLAAASLLAIAPWYLAVGRPAFRAGHQDGRGWPFVGGLVVLASAAAWAVPESAFALFVLCPMAFMALPLSQALLAVVGLSLAPLAVSALHGPGRLSASAPMIVLGLGFTILAGTYLDRTIRINQERGRLITELEASRAEVQMLSHRAGVDEERIRLTGEIHDTLAQGFTSVITLTQAAQGCIRRDPTRAAHFLELAVATSRENLSEARALVSGHTPVALSASSLHEALTQLVDGFGQRALTVPTYSSTGTPRELSTANQVVLLRTAQEALTNVSRHSRAQSVRVDLTYAEHLVRLTVQDDGVGFVSRASGSGFGLTGMRARATQVGADLSVRSDPGLGTIVSVTVSG